MLMLDKDVYFSAFAKYPPEKRFRLLRFDMHSHLIVFLTEEEYVVTKYESHHLVEFKHGIDASDEKSSEGVELVEIVNYDLIVGLSDGMESGKHRYVVIQSQLIRILMRLAEFLIYFLDYAVCDHTRKE